MEETFKLRYTGRKLKTGMNAEDVAAAIQGFAAIARVAGAAVCGEGSRIDFKVNSVEAGSLNIGFLMEVAGAAATLFPIVAADGAPSPNQLLSLIKSWIALLKHLGGKPPAKVQKVSGGNAVQIQNAEGNVIIIQNPVFNIMNNADLGKHFENVVRPLRREAENLDIEVKGKSAARISKKEIAAYKSVRKAEAALKQESTVLLKVVAPVLEGNGAWRFSTGRNTITATVADPDFLADVQNGQESFRAGDILTVRLKSVQERIGTTIKDNHTIEKVISHERLRAASQKKFELNKPTPKKRAAKLKPVVGAKRKSKSPNQKPT